MEIHLQHGQLPLVSAVLAVVSFASAGLAIYISRRSTELNSGERLGIGVSICVACLSLFAVLVGMMTTTGLACAHVASVCE